jgi:hypothetical protein
LKSLGCSFVKVWSPEDSVPSLRYISIPIGCAFSSSEKGGHYIHYHSSLSDSEVSIAQSLPAGQWPQMESAFPLDL